MKQTVTESEQALKSIYDARAKLRAIFATSQTLERSGRLIGDSPFVMVHNHSLIPIFLRFYRTKGNQSTPEGDITEFNGDIQSVAVRRPSYKFGTDRDVLVTTERKSLEGADVILNAEQKYKDGAQSSWFNVGADSDIWIRQVVVAYDKYARKEVVVASNAFLSPTTRANSTAYLRNDFTHPVIYNNAAIATALLSSLQQENPQAAKPPAPMLKISNRNSNIYMIQVFNETNQPIYFDTHRQTETGPRRISDALDFSSYLYEVPPQSSRIINLYFESFILSFDLSFATDLKSIAYTPTEAKQPGEGRTPFANLSYGLSSNANILIRKTPSNTFTAVWTPVRNNLGYKFGGGNDRRGAMVGTYTEW